MSKKVIQHKRSRLRFLLLLVTAYISLVYLITAISPAPRAVSMGFEPKTAKNVNFLADLSWIDAAGDRQLTQQIFDTALQMINEAESLIVLDMFLFNDWQGPVRESYRALSHELTDALIQRKLERPEIVITVISDPVNAVYGGLPSKHFVALRAAGVDVVLTDLTQLQDSNPLYSGIWRWLVRPFGNGPGSVLPNPFGPGKVSIRSYLALLNFKANHRKLLIADKSDVELFALVSSANPHDGSSAHRNVALSFSGAAVVDLLRSEQALLSMSGADASWQAWPATVQDRLSTHADPTSALAADTSAVQSQPKQLDATPLPDKQPQASKPDATRLEDAQNKATQLQIVSESRIEDSIIAILSAAGPDDQLDLVMFYLSDRDIVTALKDAQSRGVQLRVLLDVNQDAFGRKKKGVPNRPVAAELVEHGVPVRWCATIGEQCHAKMIYRLHSAGASLLLGSGNYTRRNLEDFNLETNALLQTSSAHPAVDDAVRYFEDQWSNEDGRTYSVDYQQYANDSAWLKWRYRFMEATGFGTF